MDRRNAADELAELGRTLSEQSDLENQRTIQALVEAAHRLGVPTNQRRDDAPVFLAGTESIESATWTQCGGLLFALAHDQPAEARVIAARVARRIATLLPTGVPRGSARNV
jgi:hypothetical protein